MNVFFNVTENDRIETIEKRVDATKLLNEFISGNIDPEYAKTALKMLDTEIHIVTSYHVFKRDVAKAKEEGEYYTITFNTEGDTDIKENYIDNAQKLTEAIISKSILDGDCTIGRIFAGPAASVYLKLNDNYSHEGSETCSGIYCTGRIDYIPIYRAPKDIIPNDTIIVERADSILECKLENLRGM